MPLNLGLLGPLRVYLNSRHLDVAADKPTLLLCYLAYHDDWVNRAELAFLFWPDADEEVARRNLRQLLHRLKTVPWAEGLEIEPQRVRFEAETDVKRLRDALEKREWARAVAVYQGPLLEGLHISDMSEFEAWLTREREDLHAAWREATLHQAEALERSQRHRDASRLLRRLWYCDKLDEDVLQAYMRNAYMSGEREQALAAYEAFCLYLRNELMLTPLPTTMSLADTIRRAEVLAPPERTLPAKAGLPHSATTFVGRSMELKKVGELLEVPDCRLLAIVGPGGVGKTRLALQAAKDHEQLYRHGVHFVPLAAIRSPDHILLAIAEALSFVFYGPETPESQLLNYLRKKEMLLVVDNFEHVIEGAGLLIDLLEEAPGLNLLVTSRQRLHLGRVWHLELSGLNYIGDEGRVENSEAAQVFLQAARRAEPQFSVTQDELVHLHRLCELLEGLPLALELAAAWVPSLCLAEITDEIQYNLDFLGTDEQVIKHHSSMRAVFEHSWSLLSTEEQHALARLSVFHGGFTRRAAQHVAGASLYVLLSLVGKSLVGKNTDGRYDVHELVRQYANEKLSAVPEAGNEVCSLHAGFYAEFLEQEQPRLDGTEQRQAILNLLSELDNIRSAWSYLVEQHSWGDLLKAQKSLGYFYHVRGLHSEGEQAFSHVVSAIEREAEDADENPDRDVLLGRALERQGWFGRQLGHNDLAKRRLLQGFDLLERANDQEGLLSCCISLGALFATLGDFPQAKQYFAKGVSFAESLGNVTGLANGLNGLGNVHRALGDLDEAVDCYMHGVESAEAISNRQAASTLYCNLGVALWYKDRREDAKQATERSHSLADELGDLPLKAVCLANLAEFAFEQHAYKQADRLRQQSLDLRRQLGDREGEAFDVVMLGYNACRLERFTEARAYFLKGLGIAKDIASQPTMLDSLLGLAELEAKEGRREDAFALLTFVHQHPATQAEAKERAATLIASLTARLNSDPIGGAKKKPELLNLEGIAEILLREDHKFEEVFTPVSKLTS